MFHERVNADKILQVGEDNVIEEESPALEPEAPVSYAANDE